MAVSNQVQCQVWATRVRQPRGTPQWNGGAGVPNFRSRMPVRGGIDFSGAHIPGPPNSLAPLLYITAQGVQGTAKYNFGPEFLGAPPEGFFPGWPTANFDGIDALDPTTVQGGAFPTGNSVTFGATFGLIQSATGHRFGNFYIEYTHVFNTFFAGNIGAGISRLAPDINFWSIAGFDVTDSNGGAKVGNGSLGNGFAIDVQANEGANQDIGAFGVNGVTVGLAISILPPPSILTPADMHPISMNCVPCAPLFPGHRVWRAFGG